VNGSAWYLDANNPIYKRVARFYQQNHSNQTLEFALSQKQKFCQLNRAKMGIWEVIEWLDNVLDESDPDLNITQIAHCFQTAEALRRKYPKEEYDWLHLIGLIHDCGKILVKFGEPQWAVVGDTYPVGCKFKHSTNMQYPQFFKDNPDLKDSRYNTDLGIYTSGCGLSKVQMSWGHDEYFYMVLAGNNTRLPPQALYIVRYHSFWYWHYGGDYKYLESKHDKEMLKYLMAFRECDLYSKDDNHVPDISKLKPYYQSLIDKYLPALLTW